MLDKQDGQVEMVTDGLDEVHELDTFLRVHAGGGFVQQQHAGLGGQGAGDLQTALGTVGQVAGLFVPQILQVHGLQQAVGDVDGFLLFAAGGGVAGQGAPDAGLGAAVAADHHVLQHGHVAEQTDVLEGAGHAQRRDEVGLAPVEQMLLAVGAVQVHGAFRGLVDAGDAVEEGGLAGAVGADEGHDLTFVDGQVQLVEGAQTAEVTRQALDFKDGFHARSPLLPPCRAVMR